MIRELDHNANPVMITGLHRTRDFVTRAAVKTSNGVGGGIGFTVPLPTGSVGVGLDINHSSGNDYEIGFAYSPSEPCTWDYAEYIEHRDLEDLPEARDFTNSIALRYVQLSRLDRIRYWIRIKVRSLRGGEVPEDQTIQRSSGRTIQCANQEMYTPEIIGQYLEAHDAIVSSTFIGDSC
ncbi:hypothetical protein C8R47DRAFT_612038 [Mycena vitilis]|nr:hypothetical protein C8R47DRAFT_612038 [Mycena vitilis]